MLPIKKILVPTDLSPVSVPAIGYASSLAKDHGAEVVLLHVVPVDAMKEHFTAGYGEGLAIPGGSMAGLQRKRDLGALCEQKSKLMLDFVEQRVTSNLRAAIRFRPLVKLGKVVDETVAVAKEEQCDLIVMTSEGRRLKRLLGASNTERVVRQAPCPVLSMQPSAQIRTENDQRLQVKLIDQWAA